MAYPPRMRPHYIISAVLYFGALALAACGTLSTVSADTAAIARSCPALAAVSPLGAVVCEGAADIALVIEGVLQSFGVRSPRDAAARRVFVSFDGRPIGWYSQAQADAIATPAIAAAIRLQLAATATKGAP